MNPTKRIVLIDGDAFDADAIVAIIKTGTASEFAVYIRGVETGFDYDTAHSDMAKAIDAWRAAVGDRLVDPIPPAPDIVPGHPPEKPIEIIRYWSDEKGRYYETYSGNTVYFDPALGNFIWNEGPPRRRNPLGEGASPIVRVYVDEAGKPLDPQPV